VLYGDNAVGGVINIVTKTGVGGPLVTIRGEAGAGSFNQRLANVSVATNYGPWSTSFYGNGFKSDGYRVNNALDQRNGVGNLNYTTPDLKAFLTVTGDDQKLGFPGGRLVDPSIGLDQLAGQQEVPRVRGPDERHELVGREEVVDDAQLRRGDAEAGTFRGEPEVAGHRDLAAAADAVAADHRHGRLAQGAQGPDSALDGLVVGRRAFGREGRIRTADRIKTSDPC